MEKDNWRLIPEIICSNMNMDITYKAKRWA